MREVTERNILTNFLICVMYWCTFSNLPDIRVQAGTSFLVSKISSLSKDTEPTFVLLETGNTF
jgi:hypothetical protein